METDRLEEFVRNNRRGFDQLEPSQKVWENISAASKKTKTRRLNVYLLRVAAVFIVVLVTSVMLYKSTILSPGYSEIIDDPEMRELMEAETFYAQQVSGKLKEIRKCYSTFPELKVEIESDLTELEFMYNELKNDLRENISNKAVIEAMIDNNRKRLKLVDEVLDQINC
ncbi:hypothetical protein D1164_13665 [Mariniphaga sediminis]|jgi:hypothetical protein|uniref:Anti-sigma factor n=1 Tax=Mariniphaga sediminis TaxID=1628158 RepID=A0A399CZU9_9BACT|nr:hypothetical protein [Mariniphaga sediminis]RIH64683.1 hypothetical protein D1164_13665 [Mariniphaga sediminis]